MPAIVFDVDDTLYDLAEPYRKAVLAFFGDDTGLPLDELFKRSRIHSDEAFALVEAGKRPISYMHAYRVQATFEEYGIEVSEKDALAFQTVYSQMQGEISLSAPVREMLQTCVDSGWGVGVITNGESRHQWRKLEALGIPDIIDRKSIVVSGDVGCSKPDVGVFRVSENLLGTVPLDCWFVGDTYENDVVGSLDAGWKCIWFDRRGRGVSAGERIPDIIVRSEQELVSTVRGLIESGAQCSDR